MADRAARASAAIGLATVIAAVLCLPGAAVAQDRAEPLPKDLEGVGITDNSGQTLPLDAEFTDEAGRPVSLRSFFHPGRPVILTLNYYTCPMLCTLELNGLVDGLKQLAWLPGNQFEVVTVSINPREAAGLAAQKKASYVAAYGNPRAADGWHFLTGNPASIRALTQAAGFGYRELPNGDFAHSAAIFVATPEGQLSRVLYGVVFDERTLRLTLAEASRGKIGSALDQILLYCYHYDAGEGRYTIAAVNVMRLGGALTVLILGVGLLRLWLKESRQRRAVVGHTP